MGEVNEVMSIIATPNQGVNPKCNEISDRINAEHRAARDFAHVALEHAIECGRLLTEAKAQVEHGEWGKWLGNHFEGSARTAQSYMQFYAERDTLKANAQRVAHLGIREALEIVSDPWIDVPQCYVEGGRIRGSEALKIVQEAITIGLPIFFDGSRFLIPHNAQIHRATMYLCCLLVDDYAAEDDRFRRFVGTSLKGLVLQIRGKLPMYRDREWQFRKSGEMIAA